jgi:hypothetical protein
MNIDTFCLKFSSDELESLKDVLFRDRQNNLKKSFWMYEREHNANKKLKELKEYSDKYLAINEDVKIFLFYLETFWKGRNFNSGIQC